MQYGRQNGAAMAAVTTELVACLRGKSCQEVS